jgi:hypothetical protein
VFNFHIEEKIALNTWDDVDNRPRYESTVDPQANRYNRIIALYSFNDHNVRCAVSDCNQLHTRGFLVTTSDDKETCLCDACGERFFDTTYEQQKKVLLVRDRLRDQKIRLNLVLEQSEKIRDRVNELKRATHGANWLYRALSNFQKSYPAELLTALIELASDEEDNAILSTFDDNITDQYQMEQIKQLQGLDIFKIDIKEALIGKILKPLRRLEEIAENQKPDSNPSLATWCKWSDSLEEQFTYAEYLLEEGRAFFNAENIERLTNIPLPEKSAHLTRSLRWDYDKAIIKRK